MVAFGTSAIHTLVFAEICGHVRSGVVMLRLNHWTVVVRAAVGQSKSAVAIWPREGRRL